MDTWCSTAQVRATGRAPVPNRTRPVTTIRCAWSSPPALPPPLRPARATRRAALRSELPEVFRIEDLQESLQRFRIERTAAGRARRSPTRFGAGLSGFHGGQREQAVARVDRGFEPERDGDRIGRPGIDLDHRVTALDMELRVIRVVLHLGDDDLPQVGTEAEDHLLQQVVGERPRELDAGELHGDGARFGRPDPYREHSL